MCKALMVGGYTSQVEGDHAWPELEAMLGGESPMMQSGGWNSHNRLSMGMALWMMMMMMMIMHYLDRFQTCPYPA
jgi:hypothetical protein